MTCNRSVVLAWCILVVTCGCGSHVKLKPMPVIYGPDKVDLCALIPESKRTPDLQVFYATNRVPKGPADKRQYTNGVDKTLHLGAATVHMGGDGETWEEVCKASKKEGGDPTFSVERASEFSESAEFYAAINQQLNLSPNREVNVYIHGFKTWFDWEVALLGKLFHCSGRRGAVVCFAWPSRQSLMVYGSDVDRGRASAHYLADLIEGIALHTDAEHINVLAYSCGAAIATDGLMQLHERLAGDNSAELKKRLHLGNVIYAASDIDLKTFAADDLVKLKTFCQNVVVYINENDAALGMASLGTGGSRLGRPDASSFTKDQKAEMTKDAQLQIIDVTDVPGPKATSGGFGGHGYWYANDWILTDLLVTFRWQISPDQRGLIRKPGLARWYFPKDYPKQITEAVLRLAPTTTAPSN